MTSFDWVRSRQRFLRSQILTARRSGTSEMAKRNRRSSLILNGGPSHLDTFDPKPDAPDGIRSDLRRFQPAFPGFIFRNIFRNWQRPLISSRFCAAYLTRLPPTGSGANMSTREVVLWLRSNIQDTELFSHKERPVEPDIPPFVAIPNGGQRSGFLGIQYAPLNTGAAPTPGNPSMFAGFHLGKASPSIS